METCNEQPDVWPRSAAPAAHIEAEWGATIDPEPSDALALEIERLPNSQTLFSTGDYLVVLANRHQVPRVVREIGRLRELAFRAVGEGSGNACDVDEFDNWYQHLFVWSRSTRQVLGAYRLAFGEVAQTAMGCSALYTRSLFRYDRRFLSSLGPAIELGRSFVRTEFQRSSRVLALLWKGIGRLVAQHPQCCTLFGPVSVSAAYTEESRQLIAKVLSSGSYRHPLAEQIGALHPVAQHRLGAVPIDPSLAELSAVVSRLEPDGKGLPTLLREYIKLSGRFLSFSIDPDFAGAMDGLVAVDLRRTDARLLSLYMGNESYQTFRRAQSSGHHVFAYGTP
jgi:hypothetical protein